MPEGKGKNELLLSERQYAIFTGKNEANNVIPYQIRQSFTPGKVTPEEANRIGCEFASHFLKGRHAFIICTHQDRAHVHNHIIWSSPTLDCTRKFRDFYRSGKIVARLSNQICVEHRLSVIENPQHTGNSYNKWLEKMRNYRIESFYAQPLILHLLKNPKTLTRFFVCPKLTATP